MFVRVLIASAVGLLCGACAGGLTFGWDASMAVGSSFIGPTSGFWPLSAMFWGACGAVCGLGLGLYAGLARAGVLQAAVAGGCVGLVGVFAILWFGEEAPLWRLRSWPSRLGPLALSVLLWALTGLLAAAACRLWKGGR